MFTSNVLWIFERMLEIPVVLPNRNRVIMLAGYVNHRVG